MARTHAPPAPPPTDEVALSYLVFLGAVCLVVAAFFLGFIIGCAPYGQAAALAGLRYHDEAFLRLALPLTPARYNGLRILLGIAAALGLGVVLGLRHQRPLLNQLRQELRHGRQRGQRWLRRLPAAARAMAAGLLALLVAVRVWYALTYPLSTDEVASHDFFVRESLLAISSFYPIPNNHIFYNLLAWPLAAAGLPPYLVMRLPTLVLGTLGTAAGYVLLARRTGLLLATGSTGLVGLTPLWVYYGAVGRGYFVQLCLLQIGFFAVAELLRPGSPYRHLSWLGLIVSSALGLYTVPTYAYPLAGLLLGLGGGLLTQRRGQALRGLVVAGAGIGLLTLLLYLPVLTVSGGQQLLANRYIVMKPAAVFWGSFRAILYETAAELFGPTLRLSGPAWLGGALLGGLLVRRSLPKGPAQTLGLLTWVMLATPLLLMAVQRVNVPARALLYVTFFGYLLAGLLLTRRWPWRTLPPRRRGLVLLLAVTGMGGLRLYRHQEQVQQARHEARQLQQAYRWLEARHRATGKSNRLWLNAPEHELYFAHYARQAGSRGLALHSGRGPLPRDSYDYVVIDNYFLAGYQLPNPRYHRVYADKLASIYTIVP